MAEWPCDCGDTIRTAQHFERAFATIGHPVSSVTDDGLRDMSRIALDQGRRLLLRP